MATFKVTVSEKSQLGQHLAKLGLEGRDRSREISTLATVGLTLQQGSLASSVAPLELKDTPKRIEIDAVKEQSPSMMAVDFGEELMGL